MPCPAVSVFKRCNRTTTRRDVRISCVPPRKLIMARRQSVTKPELRAFGNVWPEACCYQGVHRSRWPGAIKVEGKTMLHYALIFFLIAIVAAVFGFGGISVASAGIAKILFMLFLVVFLV